MHSRPIWYRNEITRCYENVAPFITAFALIGARLTDDTYQEFVLTNCPRGYTVSPPDMWFKSVDAPNIPTPCSETYDLLCSTGRTLVELLLSDEFASTDYTHMLALEDPLAYNFDLTNVHERNWKEIDPEIYKNPNFQIYDNYKVIPRSEWHKDPHPLDDYFEPKDKLHRCDLCGKRGHTEINCIQHYDSP